MPEIKSPVTGRVDHPVIRQRKRGTSIAPSLPSVYNSYDQEISNIYGSQSALRGKKSRDENSPFVSNNGHTGSQQRTRTKTKSFLPPINRKQLTQERIAMSHGPKYDKRENSSSSVSRNASLLPHPNFGDTVTNKDNNNGSSVEEWLETVKSPTDTAGDTEDIGTDRDMHGRRLPERTITTLDITRDTPLFYRTKRDPVLIYQRICELQRLVPVDKFIKQLNQSQIDLRNHLLGPDDIKGISIVTALLGGVQELDISGNNIGPKGTGYLAEVLQGEAQINKLVMAATFPDIMGCRRLSNALHMTDCLRVLNLSENSLGERHVTELSGFIQETRALQELYLNHNRLDEAGGRVIGTALAKNESIRVLDLTWNHLRRGGAEAICSALKVNTTLEKLNISWNGFSVEGCKCLSKVLPLNDTLRHLDLSSNRINSRALIFLLKGLVKNEGITCLKIGNNPFTTEAAITIIEALTWCDFCSVSELDISDVPVDSKFLAAVERLHEKRIVSIRHGPLYRFEEIKQGSQTDTLGLERFDPILVMYEFMKLDSMRLVDMFHYFDLNQNGYISMSELREGFANANIPLTVSSLEELMKTLDTDHDGKIDLQELMAGHRRFSRSVAERNRIAKSRRKQTEDKSLQDLRRIIRKLLQERNEKFKDTKSEAEPKTETAKPSRKLSVSRRKKSRRISRRSRPSTERPTLLPLSIPEDVDDEHAGYLHTVR